MSAFKSDLVGKINGRRITLTQDLIYESDLLDKSVLMVPAGFNSDLASVPWGLWNLIPPWGPYADAAVIHDYLYRVQVIKPRKFVDQIFLEAMEVKQCRWVQRWAIYLGVRIGGWLTWRLHEKNLAQYLPHSTDGVHDADARH